MPDYDLIIRDGWAALPDSDAAHCDIACQDGQIVRVDTAIDSSAKREIDAGGKLVLPGIIDAQVHFRDPGFTHKEDLDSGSRAAVSGGVTSFLEMPNTSPTTTDQQALDRKLARAADCSAANYGFFIGATCDNLDVLNAAQPACGIKIFMGSSTGSLLVYEQEHLENIFAHGNRLIAVHAEDEERLRLRKQELLPDDSAPCHVRLHSEIRDAECALIATRRAAELSSRYGRRLHILHLTSGIEVEYLRENKNPHMTVEVTPNHLFLTVDDYERMGTRVQMNPPIRTAADQQLLWDGLHDGTIDFIATDHAPHTAEEKSQPYPRSPSGTPGVQTMLPLMLTACFMEQRCSLEDILKWLCWRPAQAYGIAGKGKIQPGYDADLVICDIENTRVVNDADMLTKVKWSPFHGRALTGWPIWTIVSGQVAYENSKICEDVRGTPIRFATHPA